MTRRDDIEQLFKTYYAAMHRMAILILRDEDEARDIVHDVFESILRSGLTDVSGQYLLRAVHNRCLNHIRSLSTKERLKELYAVDEKVVTEEEWPDKETVSKIHSTVANNGCENKPPISATAKPSRDSCRAATVKMEMGKD